MKITMVGTSGSGKTVFSAGVYGKMMRRTFEKFAIIPRAANFSEEILESHKFARDYKMLAAKKWPPGTTETKYYPLNLVYDGRSIVMFDWIDYRGGFLDDPELDEVKAAEVHANIAASNAVILFADAQKLVTSDDPDEASFVSGADAVMQILQGYSRNYPSNNLTFIIALTKADGVESKWMGTNSDFRPLMDYARQVFQPIHEIIQREKTWRGGIIPVSTMGIGNVDANGNIVGFPKPMNIEHVIAYCLGSTLRNRRDELIDDIITIESDIESIDAKYKGLWGVVKKTYQQLRGVYSDGEALAQHRRERREDIQELLKIRDAVERLEEPALEKIMMMTKRY
ncbi:MAG: hypothetical protein L6Q98_21515 [Anaerolineae bacterium]|nr:hypothetical protein [Anaerolineae bacterium]NUQ05519.1 hypothetical protein [Anaerolineae bacterium]